MAKAKEELEQEVLVKEDEKDKYLSERAPPLHTGGMSINQLQVSCFASTQPAVLKTYDGTVRCPSALSRLWGVKPEVDYLLFQPYKRDGPYLVVSLTTTLQQPWAFMKIDTCLPCHDSSLGFNLIFLLFAF